EGAGPVTRKDLQAIESGEGQVGVPVTIEVRQCSVVELQRGQEVIPATEAAVPPAVIHEDAARPAVRFATGGERDDIVGTVAIEIIDQDGHGPSERAEGRQLPEGAVPVAQVNRRLVRVEIRGDQVCPAIPVEITG